jgi:hypothetical protein
LGREPAGPARLSRQVALTRTFAGEPDRDAEGAVLVGEVLADPEPGKTMIPIGMASSMRSLRLNGAALLCRAHSGLKAIWGTFAVIGPAVGDALGGARAAGVQQHHAGVLGVHPVEHRPDALVILAVEAASEADARRRGQQDLGLGAAPCGEEVAAVDHRRGQGAVVEHGAARGR